MIYERMKDIREYYDNTQNGLANILNVSRSTYAGWENGIDNIPLLKLNDFCNYYKISMDYICGLTTIKKCNIINDKIDKKIIGKNLKEIRNRFNDTQENTANYIKVDQSNYSKYELGKILINTYPLIEFAKHYKVSMDYICGKTNEYFIK